MTYHIMTYDMTNCPVVVILVDGSVDCSVCVSVHKICKKLQ